MLRPAASPPPRDSPPPPRRTRTLPTGGGGLYPLPPADRARRRLRDGGFVGRLVRFVRRNRRRRLDGRLGGLRPQLPAIEKLLHLGKRQRGRVVVVRADHVPRHAERVEDGL